MSAVPEFEYRAAHYIDSLVRQAEAVCEQDAELCEAAAMVLVGDVYVLREGAPVCEDGWGRRCYVCGTGKDPL